MRPYRRDTTDQKHSWHQRYQSETSTMLEELTGRLRELEIMAGVRRPSMWQHTASTGSIGSNGSSNHYGSPQGSAQGQPLYQSPPPMQTGMTPPVTGYHENAPPVQQYPVQYHQPQHLYPQHAPGFSAPYAQAQAHAHTAPRATFNFNDPSAAFPGHSLNANPHAQFGTWGGYGGPSMPDTLDEENAVPPNSSAWETTAR